MAWDGRSSRPAVSGAATGQGTHTVEFPISFDGPPTIDIPDLPDGVTVTLGEVTQTGFTVTVHGDGVEAPPVVEWVAADTSNGEG